MSETTGPIVLKSGDCRWDCVSLGEVMLRLDPGEGRIHTARCFGLRTAIATALAEKSLGLTCPGPDAVGRR